MEDVEFIVDIEVPASPARVLAGCCLLSPLLLLVVFISVSALAIVASGSAVGSKLAELGFRVLLSLSTWIAVYAAWASGRYFRARQTVHATGDSLAVRTAGLFPPVSTRRVNLRPLRDSSVHVLRYRGETDGGRRSAVFSRLAVITDSLAPFRFAPGLTLAEATDVADVLNAAVNREPLPQVAPSPVWRLRTLSGPLKVQGSMLGVGESVTPGPSPLLQTGLMFALGGVTLALAMLPALVVFTLVPESDAMTSGVLWSSLGAGMLAIACFCAARAAYSKKSAIGWTIAPLAAMPFGVALLSAGVSVSLGPDPVRVVMLLGALAILFGLSGGWVSGMRRRSNRGAGAEQAHPADGPSGVG